MNNFHEKYSRDGFEIQKKEITFIRNAFKVSAVVKIRV